MLVHSMLPPFPAPAAHLRGSGAVMHAVLAAALCFADIGDAVCRQSCSRDQRSCWLEFAGNTMTQHDTDGEVGHEQRPGSGPSPPAMIQCAVHTMNKAEQHLACFGILAVWARGT